MGKIIVEKAKSSLSICRLCDETMKEGNERLGVAVNARYTNYCHPECFLKTFCADRTPNNRGKCKLGCGKGLKKDDVRIGFQLDKNATIWFHCKCAAEFMDAAKDYSVASIAGLNDLNDAGKKEIAAQFPSAKSGPSLPKKEAPAPEVITGSEPTGSRKRTTRASSKPVVKAKEDIDEEDEEDDEEEEEEKPKKKGKEKAKKEKASSKKADKKQKKKEEKEEEEEEEEGEGDEEADAKEADRETDFGCMTVEELKEECKKYKINTWNLTKDELIQKLKEDVAKSIPSKEKTSEKEWQPPAKEEEEEEGGEGDEEEEEEEADKKSKKKQKTKEE